ncbi:MAG: DUF86 domain-containing protein [Lactobacillales bacterium]|jgi:uncharacterized protein with HEPN domain|nr:DUF86 domain-containing protein [Lactobacillales bacterium]
MSKQLRTDKEILEKMYDYILQIEEAISIFKDNEKEFFDGRVFYNSVSMPLFYITELANKLSDNLKDDSDEIEWLYLRGMRNRFAHDYAGMNPAITWETIHESIPQLKKFIETKLN